MDQDLGGMLVAPSNRNVFSVDSQDYDSSIRDDSRAAFSWPTGCELLAFEKTPVATASWLDGRGYAASRITPPLREPSHAGLVSDGGLGAGPA